MIKFPNTASEKKKLTEGENCSLFFICQIQNLFYPPAKKIKIKNVSSFWKHAIVAGISTIQWKNHMSQGSRNLQNWRVRQMRHFYNHANVGESLMHQNAQTKHNMHFFIYMIIKYTNDLQSILRNRRKERH